MRYASFFHMVYVRLQFLFQDSFYYLGIHISLLSACYFPSISFAIISVACGSNIHSASSMTLCCNTSGVSDGRISTAFCSKIFPPSGISLTRCTVAPVTLHHIQALLHVLSIHNILSHRRKGSRMDEC